MTRARTSSLAQAALVALALTGGSACSKNQLIDVAMASAPRHARATRVGAYEVLAGDMHCHVLPPDAEYHVSRELPETLRLARDEGLDFVVLTPHVPSRFFQDPEEREWVRGTQRLLRSRVEALQSAVTPLIVIPGMEYTDHRFGHVGLAFADVGEILDEVPPADFLTNPSLFFERWQAHGGITTINHPVLRPIPNAPITELRYDLSWRGFRRADGSGGARRAGDAGIGDAGIGDVFPEIQWLSVHATSIETYNASVAHLRDQFMVGDGDRTTREASHLADRIARTQGRRLTPVGGSDSHGNWLRPTMWVLASERTESAIHDAITHGRTCVRGPEGCSLEVRASDGAFHAVGASLATRPMPALTTDLHIDARSRGGTATYLVNGAVAATGADGELVRIPMSGRCSLVRVLVGTSASAPVYIDCPWATPAPL